MDTLTITTPYPPDPGGQAAIFFTISATSVLIILTIIAGWGFAQSRTTLKDLWTSLAFAAIARSVTLPFFIGIMPGTFGIRFFHDSLLAGFLGVAGWVCIMLLGTKKSWRIFLTGVSYGVTLWAIIFFFIIPLYDFSLMFNQSYARGLFIICSIYGIMLGFFYATHHITLLHPQELKNTPRPKVSLTISKRFIL